MENKRPIIIILVFFGIAILGWGLVWGVVSFIKYQRAQNNQPNTTTTEQRKIEINKEMKNLDAIAAEKKKIDADLDGLSDAEEKNLGTNPKLVDTDGDGLLDYDEINIFKTSPLVMDTDKDGLSDGYEAKMKK